FTTDTTYNEAGMVTADDKFRDMAFSYDANGRMVKATRSETPDAWTVYDALGNRVAAKVDDVWRFSIYDAFGKLVAEYGQADEGVGGVSYLQQDWQGSVRTVSNSNGFVISRTDHTAFGESIPSGVGLRTSAQGYWGTVATRQGYGLTERDEATGLDHTWFRKNEASAGRWTSPDPYKGSMDLGDPQSFNRYSYVVNQPTNFVDPSGLFCVTVSRSYWKWDSNSEIWDENGPTGEFGEYVLQIDITVTCYFDDFDPNPFPIWIPFIDLNEIPGGGGGSGNRVGERREVNENQCEGIRDLLAEEARLSTIDAASRYSVTFGSQPRQSLDNRAFGDLPDGKGGRIDQDWWMDLVLHGQRDIGGVSSGGSLLTNSAYIGGKLLWGIAATIRGLSQTYPMPYSDPGERAAIGNVVTGKRFADVFTSQWLEKYCS
ncbi:MAG: RHS repeat domain-containing protein, partial [Pyrinomonadaceae bacterium]